MQSTSMPCLDLSFRMAAEYKLFPVYKEEFHHVFQEHQEHYKPLMVRMKVVNDNGESAMDEDQWEAASKPLLLTALGNTS